MNEYGFSGNFTKQLFMTIGAADEGNRDKLAAGFPEEVAAYRKYAHESGWWQTMQDGLFPAPKEGASENA